MASSRQTFDTIVEILNSFNCFTIPIAPARPAIPTPIIMTWKVFLALKSHLRSSLKYSMVGTNFLGEFLEEVFVVWRTFRDLRLPI